MSVLCEWVKQKFSKTVQQIEQKTKVNTKKVLFKEDNVT